MTIRSGAAPAGANLYTYVSPGTGATFNIVDDNGMSLIGGNPLDYTRAKLMEAMKLPSSYQVAQNVLFYSFSADPVKAYNTGSLEGFFVMDGNQFFNLTTGTGLSSATYACEFWGKKHSMIKISNGIITKIDS